MTYFFAEIVGTFLLILLGDGVVANVLLKDTKGINSGWIVITAGWALAVFVGVFTVSGYSGAHINPAVTVGLALAGHFPWSMVPTYIIAQCIGAFIGAFTVWVFYYHHYNRTEDPVLIRATFCTLPNINAPGNNFLSEVIGTFALVFGVLYLMPPADGSIGSLDALPVALIVFAIGLSLGGTTGYAINPARDLPPRIMHALAKIKHKGDSDWSYAWIPICGPIAGSAIAALAYLVLSSSSIGLGD
ncbi:MIP/aquaporin family protein [Poriferisphaera sp. WC338]|uniref:MIP/aquaporin family protein n=1 Tax=Poriferisphaera sp. WC338 TaxID=3425129 RepID=UPI003D814E4B